MNDACLLCGRALQQTMRWRYLFTNTFAPTICARCNERFEHYTGDETEVTSLYRYNEAMQQYIQRFKFGQDIVLAHVFRAQIAHALRKERAIVMPIPMHPENKRRRTFAHVDELLRAARVPYTHLLRKTTTEMLAQKSRAERLQIQQLFDIVCDVNGRDICIVDDIYTTGTTMRHAKKVLLQAGAKSVKCWTLVRG